MSYKFKKNIVCPISYVANITPHAIAIKTLDINYSYCELDIKINSFISSLSAYKLESKKVILALHSDLNEIIVYFSLLRLKAIPFLVNKQLPSDIFDQLIKSHNIDFLFVDKALDLDLQNQINEFEKRFENPTENKFNNSQLHIEQIASIIGSSGSTGTPKQCCHLLKHHLISARSVNDRLKLNADASWLLNLPLSHVSGLSILFRVFSIGACIYLTKDNSYKQLLDSDLSHMSLVPTQLMDLLEQMPMNRFKNLKTIIIGGARTHKELVQRAILAKYPIRLTYGMTETASQISLSNIYKNTENIHSGKILDHCKVMNSNGLLYVKSSSLFEGYYENEIITLPLSENGFFNTNDLGSIDGNHHLRIFGRLDNMFISGGENIYPEEIEQIILMHPKIDFAIVSPIPDDRFGNVAVSFLKLNTDIHHNELNFFLSKKLHKYKIPKQYYMIPDGFSYHLKSARKQLADLLINSQELQSI